MIYLSFSAEYGGVGDHTLIPPASCRFCRRGEGGPHFDTSRPCIFRRGQLSRFLLWVPWEVFHMVVCLIIYIVRTSFGGDSYRLVLFLGSLGSFPHGTLPDYLHRPYIFRRGQLPRFFFWVSWEVYVLIDIFNIPLF